MTDSLKSSIEGNTTFDHGVDSVPIGRVKEAETVLNSPWTPPVESRERLLWAVCLPLRTAAYYTMPNCRLEKWKSWFLVSFFMSMLWISIFSYVMVWMITIIGKYFYYFVICACSVCYSLVCCLYFTLRPPRANLMYVNSSDYIFFNVLVRAVLKRQ